MTSNTSFEVFRHTIQTIVVEIGNSFTEPEDDWHHVLINESEEGNEIMMLDGRLFQTTDLKKTLVYRFLVPHLRERGAYRYALVNSAWMLTGSPEELSEILQDHEYIRDNPKRIEAVVIQVVDREQNEMWMAEIKRYKDKPPELGEWNKADKGTLTGLMVDPLIEALREDTE